jgi:glycosyltransferase involved in cell wall biosynthesis
MARILLLSQDPTIRGGGTRVASVAKEMLGRLGHECVEAYAATMSHPRLSVMAGGGPVRWVDSAAGTRALLAVLPELQAPPLASGRLALRRLARVESWDHVLVAGASIYHGAAALGLGLPTSVWGATTIGDERRSQWKSMGRGRWVIQRLTVPLLARAEQAVLRAADRVAAMSPHACNSFEAVGGRPVDLLYPPVPLSDGHDTNGRAAALEDGRLRCIFVGRVADPRKCFGRVLEVVGDLARSSHRGHVELAVTATADEISRFAVPDAVRLRCLGYPSDAALQTAVSEAHWLLLGSRQEGFGFVVAEALACGTPAASTPCGGPEAMLAESRGGFVSDISQMATLIARTTTDEWVEMSRRGRTFAENVLSADVALPAFAALLGAG